VLELLQERATLFSDLVQATARGETGEEGGNDVRTSSSRNLFRADTPHAPKAEPLLLAAISEGKELFGGSSGRNRLEAEAVYVLVSVDRLTGLLLDGSTQRSSLTNGNQEISSESPDTCELTQMI